MKGTKYVVCGGHSDLEDDLGVPSAQLKESAAIVAYAVLCLVLNPPAVFEEVSPTVQVLSLRLVE